jgi:hypothetical protein
VAAGAGGVWVLASGGLLQRIDPAANQGCTPSRRPPDR